MVEPTSPPMIERPRETEVYRPLSGLAVAAFGLAVAYAIALAIVALTSLLSRTPPFLPPWTLVFPAAAYGLALAATQHLRYAEGTRSGETLVTWAKRLCVLGFVYLALYVAIFVAVKWQAEKFTRDWFKKIQTGQIALAFLDTRKPDEREGDDANAEERVSNRYGNTGGGKGEYPMFRDQDLVHMLAAGDAKIEDQGVRELEYEQGGYRVELSYRITTPEGAYDWIVSVRSSTTGKERKWMIVQGQTRLAERPQLTPLGETRAMIKDDAHRFIMQSANKRSMGDLVGFYIDTVEPKRRAEIANVLRARTAGVIGLEIGTARWGGPAFLASHASLADAERSAVPGFDKFKQQSIAVAEPPPRTAVPPLLAETAAAFCRPDTDLRLRVGETGRLGFTVVNDTTVRCDKEVDIALLDRGNPLATGPKVTFEGRMEVEGVTPEGYQRPEWRVVRVTLIREKPAGPDKSRPPGR